MINNLFWKLKENFKIVFKKTFLFLSFFFCSNFLFTIIFYFVELWKHRPNSHKSKSRTETNAPRHLFFYFFSFCASVLLNTRNFFGSTVFLKIKVVPYRIESHCKIIVERKNIWREATKTFIEDPSSQQPLPQLGLLNVLSELIPST